MEIALHSFGLYLTLCEQNILCYIFSCINNCELIDRLYRRYVRHSDVFPTFNILTNNLCEFVKDNPIYAEIAEDIISKVEKGIKNSEYSRATGQYDPIKIVLADIPYRLCEIPLENYDNLEGDPLWLRPEYMLAKYG